MAPLTRRRTGPRREPDDLTALYYEQRASAGLIISEATSVSPQGVGYWGTPGIWTDEQAEAWSRVTSAVHRAGGRIYLQLWHVGRVSDPVFHGGEPPVAPSAVPPAGRVRGVRPMRPYVVPRALELAEIATIVKDFGAGAARAKAAGFDGVEVHSANGYLIDQFLQDSTNNRDDAYGGSIENRARLLNEVVEALSEHWDPARIGVHLRPRGEEHDMGDSDPAAVFGHVASEMRLRGVGFLFVREIEGHDSRLALIKDRFGGPVVANEEMDAVDAQRLLASGVADAVAFGRDFLANPDLPERLRLGAELNTVDTSTVYPPVEGSQDNYREGAEIGYTDYPAIN